MFFPHFLFTCRRRRENVIAGPTWPSPPSPLAARDHLFPRRVCSAAQARGLQRTDDRAAASRQRFLRADVSEETIEIEGRETKKKTHTSASQNPPLLPLFLLSFFSFSPYLSLSSGTSPSSGAPRSPRSPQSTPWTCPGREPPRGPGGGGRDRPGPSRAMGPWRSRPSTG